jgi:putative ABC transport system permease protein
LLSVLGGTAGVMLGTLAAAGYAVAARESISIPAAAVGGGIAVAISAGLLAGAYPAVRAARLEPAEALRAT